MAYLEPCAFLVVLLFGLLIGVGQLLELQLFRHAHDSQVQCLPHKLCGIFDVYWGRRATRAKVWSGLV